MSLERLLADRSPAFVCEGAGKPPHVQFTARITHDLHPPATPTALTRLQRIMPSGSEQIIAFYRKHDGFVLYRDTLSAAAGVELFQIEDLAAWTEEMYRWLAIMIDDEADTNHLKTSIAIGQVPHSGNYFAIPVVGKKVGMVFYVDHDDWQEDPFAQSFHEFLERIAERPAELLSEVLGCYARYSDGQTDTQWIPIEYIGDIDARSH